MVIPFQDSNHRRSIILKTPTIIPVYHLSETTRTNHFLLNQHRHTDHNEKYSTSSSFATDPIGRNHPTGSRASWLFAFCYHHDQLHYQNFNKPNGSHQDGFTKPTIQPQSLFCAGLLILQKLPSFHNAFHKRIDQFMA